MSVTRQGVRCRVRRLGLDELGANLRGVDHIRKPRRRAATPPSRPSWREMAFTSAVAIPAMLVLGYVVFVEWGAGLAGGLGSLMGYFILGWVRYCRSQRSRKTQARRSGSTAVSPGNA
jgi:hypothetical protein